MDQFPDISMPPDVKEDLSIIETEDLKSDPFVRAKPIKPEPPKPEPKTKRAVSEKQKAHLANARKLAREKKAQKKKDEETKKQDIKEYAQPLEMDNKDIKTDMGTGYSAVKEQPPVSVNIAKDGFSEFLGYMDKYGDMMIKLKQEEEAKRLEAERKEKEMEAKYFKKFQDMQKTQTPQPTKSIPKKHLDILKAPRNQYGITEDPNDFGEYSNYF
jgi:hypothetical protein